MRIRSQLVAVCAIAAAALAAQAQVAVATTPAPGYEQFAGCPSSTENSTIAICTHATINGGYFQMSRSKTR